MEEIMAAIQNYGFGIVLLAYFIFKDYKFNAKVTATLDAMNAILSKLETWHAKSDKTE